MDPVDCKARRPRSPASPASLVHPDPSYQPHTLQFDDLTKNARSIKKRKHLSRSSAVGRVSRIHAPRQRYRLFLSAAGCIPLNPRFLASTPSSNYLFPVGINLPSPVVRGGYYLLFVADRFSPHPLVKERSRFAFLTQTTIGGSRSSSRSQSVLPFFPSTVHQVR